MVWFRCRTSDVRALRTTWRAPLSRPAGPADANRIAVEAVEMKSVADGCARLTLGGRGCGGDVGGDGGFGRLNAVRGSSTKALRLLRVRSAARRRSRRALLLIKCKTTLRALRGVAARKASPIGARRTRCHRRADVWFLRRRRWRSRGRRVRLIRYGHRFVGVQIAVFVVPIGCRP